MSSTKYFSNSGLTTPVKMPYIPKECTIFSTQLDGNIVEDCLFIQVGWYKKEFESEGMIVHDSDEILIFVGNDLENPEDLCAEVQLQLENDILDITKTSVVYVPAGTAHGNIRVKNLRKPVFYYVCHMNDSMYEYSEAVPTAEKGAFADYLVEGYNPVDGIKSDAPEGFLQHLIFLDSKKIKDAPYMETVWFKKTNDTSPAPHEHEFDELVAFISSDPDDPQNLGAEISITIDGEPVVVTESVVAYVPRDIGHCPLFVPKLERPIYHFSLGNGGDYVRTGNRGNSNSYTE